MSAMKKVYTDYEVWKMLEYFSDVLIPKYEKQFNHSLEGVHFWDPLYIEQYPEEVEAAITRVETAIKENKILLDEDGEPLGPHMKGLIY